jgi:16S rRNA (guanine527-N7)-methyltransferase
MKRGAVEEKLCMGEEWIEGVVRKTTEWLDIETSEQQEQQLRAYLSLLVKWNQRINLVSRKGIEAAAADRLFDALLLWREFRPWTGNSHLDIGSGGGFPAVPIHIMAPDSVLLMAEPRARRMSFLATVAAELDLMNVEVRRCRVGGADDGLEADAHFDAITAQAVAKVDEILSVVSERLSVGGGYIWVASKAVGEGWRTAVDGEETRFAVEETRLEDPRGRICWIGRLERRC